MKKVFFLFIISLFTFSCKNEKEVLVARNIQEFYERIKNDTNSIDIPLPPEGVPYYSNNNFIIDKNGKIFHYRLNRPKINTCQPNFNNDLRPKFIGIMPKDIHEIPEKEILNYIKRNITSESTRDGVSFASEKDTFQSPNITEGISFLEADKKTTWLFIIRTMTDEEKAVMKYKSAGMVYDPYKIKWDTTKIKLPVLNSLKVQKK